VEFEINITDNAGNIGEANAAPQGSAITVGEKYGISTFTAGIYSGFQFLNSEDVTNDFFEVLALVDDAAVFNARVRVRLIPSVIQ
jgi:hypothetical protein